MPGDFMRAHTVSPRWWENPPRRKARVSKRRRPGRKASAARRRRTGQVLHATKLGRAVELKYVHAGNAKAHKHTFGRGVAVAYTADRRYLIVGPVDVNPYIEG